MWNLPELVNQLIHFLITLPDLLVTLGPRNHNLSRHKNQERHRWVWRLDSVDQSREYFRLILHLAALLPFGLLFVSVLFQPLQVNRHFHVARSHYILHLEIVVVDLEPHTLNDLRVLPTRQLAVLLWFGSSYDHLAAAENKPSSFGIAKSHDNCCKSVRIVLSGLPFPCYLLQVQFTAQIHSTHHVLNPGKTLFRNRAFQAMAARWHFLYIIN